MIHHNEDIQQSLEQMERMYRSLATLRAEIYPLNVANYRLMAEGPIDEIRRLQRDIDEYLLISDPAELARQAG